MILLTKTELFKRILYLFNNIMTSNTFSSWFWFWLSRRFWFWLSRWFWFWLSRRFWFWLSCRFWFWLSCRFWFWLCRWFWFWLSCRFWFWLSRRFWLFWGCGCCFSCSGCCWSTTCYIFFSLTPAIKDIITCCLTITCLTVCLQTLRHSA
jgi:hypothetical protein